MKICPKCTKEHSKPGEFCSRRCANSRVWSEETNAKRREWAKRNPGGVIVMIQNGTFKPLGRPVGAKINKNPPVSKVCTECSATFVVPYYDRRRNYCDQHRRIWGGYQPRSTIVHRSIYKEQQMDSGAERVFAELLDKNKIRWIKNRSTYFSYIDTKGIRRKYYPDFYLADYDVWIEVKGRKYLQENDKKKWEVVPNLQIIFAHDIKLPDL